MGYLQELDKLDRAIKDAEIRLKSIELNIEKIDHEISVLKPLKAQLEENISFLKSGQVVPLAQEFRKIKQELAKTNSRLSMITSDREKAFQATLEIKEIIDKFKRDHYRLIVANTNNVLKGKFGSPHGQK